MTDTAADKAGNGAAGQGQAQAPDRRGSGRVEWVDAAKGVGILLVIAGHVWTRGIARDVIYAFHMPLFFLLSGYMVRPQPSGPLIVRQARTLLVPFAAFSLLLLAADFGIEGARGVRPIFPSVAAGIGAIVLRTDLLRGPFTILWFIPCLFLARIAWNGVARRIPDPTDLRWPAIVLVLMSLGTVVAARTAASPFGVAALPAAFTLFWIGQLWRARPPGTAALALLLPIAVGALLLAPPVNLKTGDVGMPVLSLAGAAAITILLSRALALAPARMVAPVGAIGRVSLVIMYVHVAVIHYLAPYLEKPWLFLVALAGSLLVHLAAAATRPGRALLLGRS